MHYGALQTKLTELADKLLTQDLMLGTAESCTGGGLSFALTSLPGSSLWFERGLVTYSNAAKQSLLQVQEKTLANYGAVSEETAREMVQGLLTLHPVDLGIAITGIAGPDGGTDAKPIGTVWFAYQKRGGDMFASRFLFPGNREQIRNESVTTSLDLLLTLL